MLGRNLSQCYHKCHNHNIAIELKPSRHISIYKLIHGHSALTTRRYAEPWKKKLTTQILMDSFYILLTGSPNTGT